MNVKHIFIMSAFALTLGCSSAQQKSYGSFSDYPVYQDKWEEMVYNPASTVFSLWAPTAQEVRVLLYEQGEGGSAYKMLTMTPDKDGMWKVEEKGDLKGKFYTFNIKIDDIWQGDTPGVMAKAVGVNGDRAAIIDLKSTDPVGWEADKRPPLKSFSDIIIYEMHHRDFSIDTISGIKHRGKFLALTEDSTTTFLGEKTGIDHLKELGVTHVHLLPSFDFSSVDETKLDKPQYNWGYDPKNYNVPEGSYSTDPYKPDVRIREFKQMVIALHKAGIRVIMDVVYNHTAVTEGSNFERTVPGYFYRHDKEGKFANASACGNETASERPMMRKFMIESVCYWAKEYHIDGFRFDLMGIHDIETMNAIRQALDKIDPTIYMYGEGWAAGAPQLPEEKLAMKNNTYKMPGVAAFSDEFRDSLRGPFGNDARGAFVIGRPGHEAGIKFGLVGGVMHPQINNSPKHKVPKIWAESPNQFISYVSCHDDLCLVDRLKTTLPGASVQELMALQKLAETAVFTSQGVPFIYAGDEILRDKKGVHNSYNSSDSINAIDWRYKTQYKEVFDYVKGLIAMRKAHPAFRMGNAELISKHLEFIDVPASNVVAFRLKGNPCGDSWVNTIVVLNARTEPVKVDVPEGKYWIACRDGKIDLVMGLGVVMGNQLTVSPRSAMIVHQ
ncbi:type I pullulanase [uncultured Bacteroides sp.]|uniref:type I pullulanase n=1 Tax=uncultured Bacteroides sp. TaxID=162156 RepID=UPI00260CEF3C|nr:type I pullulanase [uncultured Bacteroides sp.]